jgi:nucleoside-specific outer membrane channel protein Tsx
VTEVQFQYGSLDVPTFATGGKKNVTQDTAIVTLQHVSGWAFGDVFFFIDFLDAQTNESVPFNNSDAYGEIYPHFSSSKILGIDYGDGLLRDVGVITGLNYGADANVFKILPGVRLSWNIPGFAFLNTDFLAYIDASEGVSKGGAPKEDDSFIIDVSWAYPIEIGGQKFSFEGHAEYVDSRDNEFGSKVESWILAQPQFRWDVGNALFDSPDKLFIGTELQYWNNKLGDKDTDEFAAQALAVWRF